MQCNTTVVLASCVCVVTRKVNCIWETVGSKSRDSILVLHPFNTRYYWHADFSWDVP